MLLNGATCINSHAQLDSTVPRLVNCLARELVGAGIHPHFDNRNFKLPIQNGQHLEIACLLAHPFSDLTPSGSAVPQRDVADVRPAKTDGKSLDSEQISVLETIAVEQSTFFIEWPSPDHPLTYIKAIAKIVNVEIASDEFRTEEWLRSELRAAIESDVKLNGLQQLYPALNLESLPCI